jgi:hypothetical protein
MMECQRLECRSIEPRRGRPKCSDINGDNNINARPEPVCQPLQHRDARLAGSRLVCSDRRLGEAATLAKCSLSEPLPHSFTTNLPDEASHLNNVSVMSSFAAGQLEVAKGEPLVG